MPNPKEPVDELSEDFFYCNKCGEITMLVDIELDKYGNYICAECGSDNLDFFGE
jgi:predicted RNA-binding Zn-ribbon protein involved in translation (DUF1610 family)